MDLSAGGHAYDRTSDVDVLLTTGEAAAATVVSRSEAGQSRYMTGGTWVDLTESDLSANFCIKALTTPEPATLVLLVAGALALLVRRR